MADDNGGPTEADIKAAEEELMKTINTFKKEKVVRLKPVDLDRYLGIASGEFVSDILEDDQESLFHKAADRCEDKFILALLESIPQENRLNLLMRRRKLSFHTYLHSLCNTPLHRAIKSDCNRRDKTIKALLSPLTSAQKIELLSTHDSWGRTPLDLAIYRGKTNISKFLVQQKVTAENEIKCMQKSIDKLTKEKADREAESALQQQEMTRLRAEIQRMQQEINRQHEVIHRGGAGVGGGSGGVKEQDVCGMINDAMQTKILAPDDYLDVSEGHLVQWLSHMDLESVASSSTRDLLDTLDKLHQDGSVGPSQVSSVVTSTLTKLIRQLSVLYTCEESSIRDRHHYSHSMIDLPVKLARGLHHSLVRVTLEEQLHVAPSQMMVTSLQEKVLSFIQQLHTSESERKRLRDNMDNMNQNINQLTQYQEACADLERELYGLRKQMERLVPGERVEEVMSELNQALDKERRAQALLSDQSMQIKQLTARMDMDTSDRDHNEQSLKFAVKQLNEELEKKTTQLSNLTRQVSGLENERRSIHDNIYDAESALKTAAQDRQTLSNYVETLSLAFNKCLSEGGQSDLSRVLLSGELIPSGRAAPDLLCVQKLVHAFIDSHSALQAKISALHSLTTEQLNEITRLKQEMTLVCTGQKTHTPNSNQVYSYPSSGYSSLSPLKLPLTDNSSLNTPPTNYDSGLMTRSMPCGHRNGVDNPSYPRPASKDNLIRGRDTLDNQLNYQNGLDSQPYPRSSSNHQSHHRSASSHYPLPPSQLSMDRMSSSVRGVPSPRLQMAGNIRR